MPKETSAMLSKGDCKSPVLSEQKSEPCANSSDQKHENRTKGDAEIVSDTMGVDFGPYLQGILHDVNKNWYNLMPESAMPPLLRKGRVSIEFAITKSGQVAGLRYICGSGDVALDRAAYFGITSSNPFPPLPTEFAGPYLGLRFTFSYNPTQAKPISSTTR
jgi:TonB family protein